MRVPHSVYPSINPEINRPTAVQGAKLGHDVLQPNQSLWTVIDIHRHASIQTTIRNSNGRNREHKTDNRLVTGATAHAVQLRQDGQTGIHPPVNAVLCTCLLGLIKSTGGDLAGDALLPAHFVQVVDSWKG